MAHYYNPVFGEYNNLTDKIKNIKLQDDGCHESWVPENFSKEKALNVISAEEVKMMEYETDQKAFLKYVGIEMVATKASLAFLNAFLGNTEKCLTEIQNIRNNLNDVLECGYIPLDYLPGFMDIISAIKQYVGKDPSEKKDEIPCLPPKCNESGHQNDSYTVDTENRTVLGRLAVKYYFYNMIEKSDDDRIGVLDELMKRDSNFFEWPLHLYMVLRFKRRSCVFKTTEEESTAWEREIQALTRAHQLFPNHPLVLLNNCRLCAEMCKRKPVNSERTPFTPFSYSNKLFVAIEGVEAYIRERSLTALKLFGQSTTVNIYVAEFFTVTLPPSQRDFSFAKECLDRALQINPKYSKTYHRMGLYYINVSPCDLNEAEKMFESAHLYNKNNFTALVDLVNVYLREPEKNDIKLKNLFKNVMHSESGYMCPPYIGPLLFLKGCFQFMQRGCRKVKAVELWTKYYEQDSRCVQFKHVGYIAHKFRWPSHKITTTRILEFMEEIYANGGIDADNISKSILEKLIVEVAKAEEQQKSFHERRWQNYNERSRNSNGGNLHNKQY